MKMRILGNIVDIKKILYLLASWGYWERRKAKAFGRQVSVTLLKLIKNKIEEHRERGDEKRARKLECALNYLMQRKIIDGYY
jgi:hypothetical protein